MDRQDRSTAYTERSPSSRLDQSRVSRPSHQAGRRFHASFLSVTDGLGHPCQIWSQFGNNIHAHFVVLTNLNHQIIFHRTTHDRINVSRRLSCTDLVSPADPCASLFSTLLALSVLADQDYVLPPAPPNPPQTPRPTAVGTTSLSSADVQGTSMRLRRDGPVPDDVAGDRGGTLAVRCLESASGKS